MQITKLEHGQIIEEEQDNVEFLYNTVNSQGVIRIDGMQIHFEKMTVLHSSINFYYHSYNTGTIWKDEKRKAYSLCKEMVNKKNSIGNII